MFAKLRYRGKRRMAPAGNLGQSLLEATISQNQTCHIAVDTSETKYVCRTHRMAFTGLICPRGEERLSPPRPAEPHHVPVAAFTGML